LRSFLIKSGLAISIAFAFHLFAGFMADGTTNNFYLRFTTPRQNSLIIGTSRAAQGLHPEPFNSILKEKGFDLPVFNFGFTVAHSPYGPAYLSAIKKKIAPTSKSGIFLVNVAPWSVITEKSNPNVFPESDRFLGKMNSFNSNPNFEFLTRFYPKAWGKILLGKFKSSQTTLLEDGRLDVTISMESKEVEKRTKKKINWYKKDMVSKNEFSEARWSYLKETIEFLQNHGKVFLIRLPVDPKMVELENNFMPDFDAKVEKLADEKGTEYFNFINEGAKYSYTDGNHLYRDSGAKLSKEIALKIKAVSK